MELRLMEVTVLPKDIKIKYENAIQLYNYKSEFNISKTKIELTKNTFSFLRSGIKELHGKDKKSCIENDSFLLMKSGNCLMTEKMPNSMRSYNSILLFFDTETLLDFVEKNQIQVVESNLNKSFFVFKYDSFILQFVKSLEVLSDLNSQIQQKVLKSKFEEIILYLIESYGSDFLYSLIKNDDDRVRKLKSVVYHNRFNKLTLEELSFLCAMSVSTFKREFFKEYLTTPMKWFSEQRLNHAAFLLKSKQAKPSDVFEEAGYESLSNFIQAFKRKFGLTPKQFQKAN